MLIHQLYSTKQIKKALKNNFLELLVRCIY